MATLTKNTVWETPTLRVVSVSGLPVGHGSYEVSPRKQIDAVLVRSMGSPFDEGDEALLRLSEWSVAPPEHSGERVVGGGLWMPGLPVHFFVPFRPAVVDGRFVVYQINQPRTVIHEGVMGDRSVSVGLGGVLASRWSSRHDTTQARDPDETQFHAMRSLVMDFLLPRFDLGSSAVVPWGWASDVPSSPGDVIEGWIRSLRGEPTGWLAKERQCWVPAAERFAPVGFPVKPDRRPLSTWEQRQEALVDLGFAPGPVDGVLGLRTVGALRAYQHARGLIVDGVWGEQVEGQVRLDLALLRAEPAPML